MAPVAPVPPASRGSACKSSGEEEKASLPVEGSPDERVIRCNAEGRDGLVDRQGSGPPSRLNDAQRALLKKAVEDGPKPYVDGVVRWRLVDLVQWVLDAFDISVSRQTLGRELRAMGLRKLSARPQQYAQDPDAIEAYKKLPRHGPRSPRPERLAAHRNLASR